MFPSKASSMLTFLGNLHGQCLSSSKSFFSLAFSLEKYLEIVPKFILDKYFQSSEWLEDVSESWACSWFYFSEDWNVKQTIPQNQASVKMIAYQCRTNHRYREIECLPWDNWGCGEGRRKYPSNSFAPTEMPRRTCHYCQYWSIYLKISIVLSKWCIQYRQRVQNKLDTNIQGTVALYHLTPFSFLYYL